MREVRTGNWTVSAWGEDEPDCIVVGWPGAVEDCYEIRTEADIEAKLSHETVPERVREMVREEMGKRLRYAPGPIDDGAGWRFEDGRVVTFRMRDDGEAEPVWTDGTSLKTDAKDTVACKSWSPEYLALLRFRDAERSKWKMAFHELGHHNGPTVCIQHASLECGKVDFTGYWHDYHAKVPTWKRREAEALWREMQAKKAPEWRTEWREDAKVVQWDGDTVVNLPENQFRDSEGNLWTFTARDDGEVVARASHLSGWCITGPGAASGCAEWERAACAYRDLIASRRPSYIPEGAEWGWTIDAKGRRVGMYVRPNTVCIRDLDCIGGSPWWTVPLRLPRRGLDHRITNRMYDAAKELWERVHPASQKTESIVFDMEVVPWSRTIRSILGTELKYAPGSEESLQRLHDLNPGTKLRVTYEVVPK